MSTTPRSEEIARYREVFQLMDAYIRGESNGEAYNALPADLVRAARKWKQQQTNALIDDIYQEVGTVAKANS